MKCVILAGGLGTRLTEETVIKPKPLVDIGGRPILWHIMKMYSHFGIDDFIICLGYKGHLIKEYFASYHLRMSDVTFDVRQQSMEIHATDAEPWRVTLVDTGDESGTGGRLRRVLPYVADDDAFCMTYGDGVADLNIADLITFHRKHGRRATVTATRPLPRFGVMHLDGDRVSRFEEKPHGNDDWVSGGFFVLSPRIGEVITGDDTVMWEQAPMRALVEDDQLMAFRHDGFWRPMDTLRDKMVLEELWESGAAPWKVWKSIRQ
jgi:glucose-1-phosphate cytidylyltransferase